MTRKTLNTRLAVGLLSGSLGLGLSSRLPAAPAAPVKPLAAATVNPMPELLSGKLYPSTVKRSDLVGSYHIVSLIDAQGRPAVCATQGAMLTLGGETFLVAYLLPPPTAKSADPAAPATPVTPAVAPGDVEAQLTLINMRDVQAIGGIHDVPPPSLAPDTPTPPAAPAAPAGTAAP